MEQKVFYEGEKSQAICENCEGLVSSTFLYRHVPFSDGSGIVYNLLAGVCDRCDSVVSIPASSTPQVKAAREAILKAAN